MGFRIEFSYSFYFGGHLADAILSLKKVESISEKYRNGFEIAVNEHVRLIEEKNVKET
jgi:hypothetical protein|tara:strand:- start:709 stop:882 length:174 start_codon:yes stop_codon:yes gene_type:complete